VYDLNQLDPAIEIETGPSPTAAIIWLHGLGADGHDFVPIVPELHLPSTPAVRFVFPHAPERPVTLNGGYVMRAWYDIGLSDRGFFQNAEHLCEAEAIVVAYVARELTRGVSEERIVLAGFSQGGNVVLHAGLHHPCRLAGLMVLSAPVPDAAALVAQAAPANRTTPVFLAHGTEDTVAPYALGQQLAASLQQAAIPVQWCSYRMPHSVCPEEIADLSTWLRRVLA
jgi:phospholipase/carboxylesterase